jgi:hypothetical protein
MHGKQLQTPWLWPTSATGAQPADPIPQGPEIFIVERQSTSAFLCLENSCSPFSVLTRYHSPSKTGFDDAYG